MEVALMFLHKCVARLRRASHARALTCQSLSSGYARRVRSRCGGKHAKTYTRFLRLLRSYDRGSLTMAKVHVKAARLFANFSDLLQVMAQALRRASTAACTRCVTRTCVAYCALTQGFEEFLPLEEVQANKRRKVKA